MNKAILRGLTLLVIGSVCASPIFAENVREDEFSVQLPAACSGAKKQVRNIDSPSGPIKNVTYIAQGSDGICIVGYSELTGPITEPDKMIDSGRDSLMNELSTSIEMEAPIERDDVTARTIRYSGGAARPLFGRTDFVVADDRLYQIVFIGFSVDSRTAAENSSFFGSFDVKIPEAPAAQETTAEVAAATTTTEPN